MKKLLSALPILALIAGCGEDPSAVAGPEPATGAPRAREEGGPTRAFLVTVENLTPATGPGSSQVFSPPVLATHDRRMRLFRVGEPASEELAQIAEDAVNGPMLERLAHSPRVFEFQEGTGPIPPGQSATYEIRAARGQRFLSMVFMLVSTNDAFSGFRVRLHPERERSFLVRAYDAGSEENTELVEHIPGPCCGHPFQRVPTRSPIRPHRGIQGHGDLEPEIWGWDGPVARVTIRPLR